MALTRARDELHCTWASTRTFGSRTAKRSPSPWLPIIQSTVGITPIQLDRHENAARARRARAALPRRDQGELDPAQQALFESLRDWRRAESRKADVPAFVIFNDATLIAVATARPRTRAQLLQVSGVGPVKAQRFGDDLLRIVAEHP